MTLEQKIKDKSVVTAIIGLGYVGLPLAHSICQAGGHVLGFDVVQDKVDQLNKGESYLDTMPGHLVKENRDKGLFEATTDFDRLQETDVIVICVPTPITKYKEPNLLYVLNSAEEIAKRLNKEQLVILESTTYPGTLKDEVIPVLEQHSGLNAGKDFYTAFSPEREDPGNPDFSTSGIPKIVGADTELERDLATDYYRNFLQTVIPVASSGTAEAIKLTENIFRAVNIALVNELKVIYAKMGIDIWDVIEGAKTKPFGYMPFYPGPGLGGHCIPIDPFYLSWKAKEVDTPTRFIELAGEINSRMPHYVCDEVSQILNREKSLAVNGAKILVLGVSYKKNINDQRESPAFPIIDTLQKWGGEVSYYDPHISEITSLREYPHIVGMKSVEDYVQGAKDSDLVLLLTDHDQLPYDEIVAHSDLIVDTRNAFAVRGLVKPHIFKA
ncbi:MAG: nucleotide sugar dehydrogenase [Alphaproteobacteria bacterium]